MVYTRDEWLKDRERISQDQFTVLPEDEFKYGFKPTNQPIAGDAQPITDVSPDSVSDVPDDQSWLKDTGYASMKNFAETGDMFTEFFGWAADKMGFEEAGAYIKGIGDTAVDYWGSRISEDMQSRMSQKLFTKDEVGDFALGKLATDPGALMTHVVSSLPMTFAGMGLGVGAARGAIALGLSKKLKVSKATFDQLKGQFAGMTRKQVQAQANKGVSAAIAFRKAQKTLALSDAIAMGYAGEGLLEGGVNALGARDNILATPHDKLYADSEAYRGLYDSADIGEAEKPGEREQFAKDMLAQQVALKVGFSTWFTTGTLSSPMGFLYSDLIQKGVGAFAKTKLRAVGRGAGLEAAQEFLQSGTSTLLTNIHMRDDVNEKLDIWENVFNDAAIGALAGSVLGGAFGISSPTAKAETRAAQQAKGQSLAQQAGERLNKLRAGIEDGTIDADKAAEFHDMMAQMALPNQAGESSLLRMDAIIKMYDEFEKTGKVPEGLTVKEVLAEKKSRETKPETKAPDTQKTKATETAEPEKTPEPAPQPESKGGKQLDAVLDLWSETAKSKKNFRSMVMEHSKADLLQTASDLGIKIAKSKNKTQIAQAIQDRAVQPERFSDRTGQQNEEFFSEKAKKPSSKKPYNPVLEVDQTTPEAKSYQEYTDGGNFTGHISKMIAGFAEKQMKVGQAIVRALKAKSFLDIGASEGGLAKTVGKHLPNARVVALDPNPDMLDNFNKTPSVDNVEYIPDAYQGSWDGVNQYETDETFDVVNEDFTFQFINNDRATQVAGVKKLLNKNGVFVTSEKFHTANSEQNEKKKLDHQRKYFSEEDITEDKQTIVSGMADDMVGDTEYVALLKENFKYVQEFWNAGDFKGYLASDSKVKIDAMVAEIGDLTSEFTDTGATEEAPAIDRYWESLPFASNGTPDSADFAMISAPEGKIGALYDELVSLFGDRIHYVNGKYNEKEEQSLFVDDLLIEEYAGLFKLARKYKQESVITGHGLHMVTGKEKGQIYPLAKKPARVAKTLQDNYTEITTKSIKGQRTVRFTFDLEKKSQEDPLQMTKATVNKQTKTYKGVHFSPLETVTELSPDKYGSASAGAESKRVSAGAPKRVFTYVAQDESQPVTKEGTVSGNVEYATNMDGVYNYSEDPLGLAKISRSQTDVEQMMRVMGIRGFFSDSLKNDKANRAGAVVYFEKTAVFRLEAPSGIPASLEEKNTIVLDEKRAASKLTPTYVVDVLDSNGDFSEHTLMRGAKSKQEAEAAAEKSLKKGESIGAISTMTAEKLNSWASKSDLNKPLSGTMRQTGSKFTESKSVKVGNVKIGTLNFQIIEESGAAVLVGSNNDTGQKIDAVVLSTEKGRDVYVFDRLRNNKFKDHLVVYGAESEQEAAQIAMDHMGEKGISTFKVFNPMTFGRWIGSGRKSERVSSDNWVDTETLAKPQIKRMSVKEVERSVERLKEGFSSVDVIVVGGYFELPTHIRERFNEAGYQDKLAATWDPVTGAAYIVGDKIEDVQILEEYIIEETVGHAGLKTFFRAENGQQALNDLFDSTYKSFKSDPEFQSIVSLYNLNMKSSIGRRHAAEEFIAKIDPEGHENLYAHFRATFNRLLRSMGFKKKLSIVELRQIMKRLEYNVANGLAPPYGREFKPGPDTTNNDPMAALLTASQVKSVKNKWGKGWVRDAKAFAAGLTDSEAAVFINSGDVGREAMLRFDDVPAREWAHIAWLGRAKKGWYRKSAIALQEVFGEDAVRFTSLLAALSPQISVAGNLENALNVWSLWVEGGREQFNQYAMEQLIKNNVRQDESKKEPGDMKAWMQNGARVLMSPSPDSIVLSGPKVSAFAQNLLFETMAVTNDSHMARFGGVDGRISSERMGSRFPFTTVKGKQTNRLSTGEQKKKMYGPNARYLGLTSSARLAAEILTDETGSNWSPAEVQETVWSWTKELTERYRAKENTRTASGLAREITHEDISSVVDFGQLLSDPDSDRSMKQTERSGVKLALDRLRSAGYSTEGLDTSGLKSGLSGRLVSGKGPFAATELAASSLKSSDRLQGMLESEPQQEEEQEQTTASDELNTSPVPSPYADDINDIGSDLPMAALTRPSEAWMDDNVLMDEDGNPKVFYHGTAADIKVFSGGARGMTFFSPGPETANDFAFSSAGFLGAHDSEASASVIPVFVKSTLFDYRDQAHVSALMSLLPDFMTSRKRLEAELRSGDWELMESFEVQRSIKELKFGGFYVKENAGHGYAEAEPNIGIYNASESIRSALSDVPMAALVHHGGPHKWDVIDLMKAGSGEGNDVYGWGFYTAQARNVASIYAANLGGVQMTDEMEQELLDARQSLKDGDPNFDMIRMMASEGSQDAAEARIARMLGETAYIYDLELDDASIEAMLDWDVPLSQQSPTVKMLVRGLYSDDSLVEKIKEAAQDQGQEPPSVSDPDATGEDLYELLRVALGGSYEASTALVETGIRGTKYLDAFSRNQPDNATRNFVVFDAADLTVLSRNGEQIGAPQPDRKHSIRHLPDGTTEYRTQQDEETLIRTGDALTGAVHATAADNAQINWMQTEDRDLVVLNSPEDISDKLFDKMVINAVNMGYLDIFTRRGQQSLLDKASSKGYAVSDSGTIHITPGQSDAILYGDAAMAALTHNRTDLGDVEQTVDRYLSRDENDMNMKERTQSMFQRLKFWENSDWMWKLKFNIADSGAYVEKMETELFGTLLDASESGYKALTMTRNLPSVIGHIFKFGLPKYINGGWEFDESTEGFGKIWEPLFNHDYKGRDLMRAFSAYAVAKRAIVLHEEGKGREKNIPLEDARRIVDSLEKQFTNEDGDSIVQTVWNGYQQFNNNLIDLLKLHGVLDDAAYKEFRDNSYVPFYRAMEEINGGANHSMTQVGVASRRFMDKRLRGSESMVDGAVFENIVMNMSSLIDSLYKNSAMKKIADIGVLSGTMRQMRMAPLLSETLRPEYIQRAMQIRGIVEGVPEDEEGIHVNTVEMYEQMVEDESIEGFVSSLAIQPVVAHGNMVTLRRNGKTEYYSVLDPMLLESLRDMHPEAMGWISKILRGPKNLLTRMVTLAPGFMLISNPTRDTVAAWVQTGFKITPFIDAWRGAVEFGTEGELAKNMMASGAGGGGWYDNTAGDLRTMLKHESSKMTKRGVARRLGRAYMRVGAIAENANRMAVAKAVIESGGTMAEAMYQAQDVLNFTMQGSSRAMRGLIQAVPFMNARVQGLYRLGRGARDNPGSMAVRGMVVAGLSMALAMFNSDDDEYDQLEDWNKDAYWHFMDPLGAGVNVKIPKPFEVGVLFGMIPERMVRLATGQDDMKKFGQRMGRAFLDTFAFNPVPQAFKPLIEVYADKNSFTGRRIVGQWLKELPPEQRMNPWTSETARLLARVMPEAFGESLRSPIVLQHLVRAYSGTMGSYVLSMADTMSRKVGGFPVHAKKELSDMPVLNRLTTGRKGEVRSNRYQGQLRDILDRADQSYYGLRKLADEGDFEGFNRLFKDNRELLMVRSGLNKYNKLIQRVNKATRTVAGDRTMGPAQKRDLLRELQKIKNTYLLAAAPLLERLD